MQHPGEILQEKLNNSNMSRKEVAIRTGVTEKHICTIINGDRDISLSFAKKLGYVFENSEFWLDLQLKYNQELLHLQEENNITDAEMEILKPLHEVINYLIEKDYIHNDCGNPLKVIQLRKFLQISDLTLIPKVTYNAAYRAQLSSNIKVNPYVLFAWQCLCEKETEGIAVQRSLNISLLKESIPEIKKIMFSKINDGINELQKIFSDCGIAFQVVKNFRGAPVQGFIKSTANDRLILCLTIRGKRADRFWFTLFHEIAHIINGDFKTRFVDFNSVQDKAENAADEFARDTLIPPECYHDFLLNNDYIDWNSITNFAEAIGVQPFIVLGRLQNDEYVDWSEFTEKIVRYTWA